MLTINFSLTKLSDKHSSLEELLNSNEINAHLDDLQLDDNGKLKISMEKNRWTLDFGAEASEPFLVS